MTTTIRVHVDHLHEGKHAVVTQHAPGSDTKTELARFESGGGGQHILHVHDGAYVTVHEEDAQPQHHRGPPGAPSHAKPEAPAEEAADPVEPPADTE